MTNETLPRKRGAKPGLKQARNFLRICEAPGCPRHGVPFEGTARAVFCSRRCNLAAWRARQKSEVEADNADENVPSI